MDKDKKLKLEEWIAAAGMRAVKTAAEAALGVIGSSMMFNQVDWKVVAGTVILSVITSLLVSVRGLPEIEANNAIREYLERDGK